MACLVAAAADKKRARKAWADESFSDDEVETCQKVVSHADKSYEQTKEQFFFEGTEKCVVTKNTFLHVYRKRIETSARRNSAPSLAWRFSFSSPSSSDEGIDRNPCAASSGMETLSATTLMMKNIPCSCKRDEVIRVLEELNFFSACNFFYLPTRKDKIIGYAFIGFPDVQVAEEFKEKMTGYQFANKKSDKIVSVVPASIQGVDSNLEHFKKSSVMRKKDKKPQFFDQSGK